MERAPVSHSVLKSRCKDAEIALDTDLAGNPEAFNPAELLLAAISACMIRRSAPVTPILKFSLKGVEVHLQESGKIFLPRWNR